MRVDREMVDDVTVLRLTGDLDARSAPDAQQRLTSLISPGTPVLLELSGVGYVSSAGLRTLLMTYRRAQQSQTSISLIGVPETLRSRVERDLREYEGLSREPPR